MRGEAGTQVFDGQVDDFWKPHVVALNQNLEDGRMFGEATNATAMNGRYVSVACVRISLLYHRRRFLVPLEDVYINKIGIGNEAIDFRESALSLVRRLQLVDPKVERGDGMFGRREG